MMNLQFTDHDIDGFVFGQMTMTGYKHVIVLDKDFPEYGWKKNDMIAVSMSDHPCFRIEPLFESEMTTESTGKVKTLKHTDRLTLNFESYKKPEAADNVLP